MGSGEVEGGVESMLCLTLSTPPSSSLVVSDKMLQAELVEVVRKRLRARKDIRSFSRGDALMHISSQPRDTVMELLCKSGQATCK